MLKLALSAALAVLVAGAACAQDATPPSAPSADKIAPEPDDADRNSFTVGIAGAVLPSYEGSNDYIAIPGGTVRGKLKHWNFFTRGSSLYVDAVADRSTSRIQVDLGPVVKLNTNRTFWIRDA